MVIQNTVTNQIVEVVAGTGNILAAGTTTDPLRTYPVVSNTGLMGDLSSGSLGSAYGEGVNTILFKNKEELLCTMDFADADVRDTALTNLLAALGDGLLAVSVDPTDGTVTDLATP